MVFVIKLIFHADDSKNKLLFSLLITWKQKEELSSDLVYLFSSLITNVVLKNLKSSELTYTYNLDVQTKAKEGRKIKKEKLRSQ